MSNYPPYSFKTTPRAEKRAGRATDKVYIVFYGTALLQTQGLLPPFRARAVQRGEYAAVFQKVLARAQAGVGNALFEHGGEHGGELLQLFAKKVPAERPRHGVHFVEVHLLFAEQKVRTHDAAQIRAAVQKFGVRLHFLRRFGQKVGREVAAALLAAVEILVFERQKGVVRFRLFAGRNDDLPARHVGGAIDLALIGKVCLGKDDAVIGKGAFEREDELRPRARDGHADARTQPVRLDDDGIPQPFHTF